MTAFWQAYVEFWTWRMGIPIAFIAATAIAFIAYVSASRAKMARAIGWGMVGFAIAYGFVWLLIGSRANVEAQWWIDEDLRTPVAGYLGLIIGVIIGIIVAIGSPGKRVERGLGTGVSVFVLLVLIFAVLFAAGNYVFAGVNYLLYGAALIAFPALPIIAIRFILSECPRPMAPLTLFGYFTAAAVVGLLHLLFPFEEIQAAVRTFNLAWVIAAAIVVGGGMGTYYLWALSRKRTDEGVENLHPLWAVGAVVLNVVLTYPLVLNYDRLSWVFIFVGVSTLIGIVLIFGRWWVLSR